LLAFNRHYSLFFPGSQRSMTTKWGRFEAHQGLKENFFSQPAFLRRPRLRRRRRKEKSRAKRGLLNSILIQCGVKRSAQRRSRRKYIIVIIAKLTYFTLFPDVGE